MKLYFRNSKGELEYVDNVTQENFGRVALDDWYKRYPDRHSYYQRIWFDEHRWMWMDVGSWSQFYIGKEV